MDGGSQQNPPTPPTPGRWIRIVQWCLAALKIVGRALWVFLFGPKRHKCTKLKPHESCHVHDTISDGARLFAAMAGPSLAMFYLVYAGSGDLSGRLSDAAEKTGYGLEVVLIVMSVVWAVAVIGSMHMRLTSFMGYFAASAALPFTVFSLVSPGI